ncbi:MAG: glycosyltransferase family 4 protein, partial [Candidatus Eremiobacteraeota bacterium]|nr:glycosyltransferase family 4 protein [Candidatus Eremiobacteraeota bacterium]
DRRLLWDQVLLPLRAGRSGAALLHCASGTMPLISGLPVIVTVHDVAWLKAQAHARSYARLYFGTFSLRRYCKARHVVVDSHFSRAELLRLVEIEGHKVSVVYPGVSADFSGVTRTGKTTGIILVVGTVELRKNLEMLIRALPELPARIVSLGPSTPYQKKCEALARRLHVADRIEFRGYVTRTELLEWYARAQVAAVPSRYEGFGYAVAQALCAGLPVLVSDSSSLPEIAAGDATLVAADDATAWQGALSTALLRDPPTESQARAVRERSIARFSWSSSARTMRDVYATVLRN